MRIIKKENEYQWCYAIYILIAKLLLVMFVIYGTQPPFLITLNLMNFFLVGLFVEAWFSGFLIFM